MSTGGATGEAGPRRPWVVLQHVDHEGPGLVREALVEADQVVEVVRPDRGESLPEPGQLEGLVVMGGPMGVHDTTAHPWLAPERMLVGNVARSGIPVLGVCLGAQLLAAALGSEVTTGPDPEIGFGRVQLTATGRRDPVLGPEYGGLADPSVPCLHWHQDTFTLPAGAVHLAATARFPHQAFRFGDRAYGLQFHVEVDRVLVGGWRAFLPDGVVLEEHEVAEVEAVGRRVLRRFVATAQGPVAAAHLAEAGHLR